MTRAAISVASSWREPTRSTACLAFGQQPLEAQDILSSQLRQGFGKNKVRYKDFQWWILESEHLELHYEPEFHDLAQRAIVYLEDGYDQISEILRHDLSTRPPIVIYQSQYEFQQTSATGMTPTELSATRFRF